MATSKIKGVDEQTLEGGLGGAGGAGGKYPNPGKQFEMSASEKAAMAERIRKSKEVKDPPEFANPGEQFKKKKGGVVSASKRADGIAQRGKTRGKVL